MKKPENMENYKMHYNSNLIDAQEDFDRLTETGIMLKMYSKRELESIAKRISTRHKVKFEWNEDNTKIMFVE